MAAGVSTLEDDMSCPVCCDLYKDPVVLGCSHSFCRQCLDTFWTDKMVKRCPMCRCSSFAISPTSNLVLRNIVETSMRERRSTGVGDGERREAEVEESKGGRQSGRSTGGSEGEVVEERCQQHGERLLFYCLEDQQPLCVVCQKSRKHREHQLCPVEEVAEDLKEEMRAALSPLKEKLETFQKARKESEKTAKYIKTQATQTKKQIACEFEELHDFLCGEEKVRISVLAEEVELKMVIMKEKTEHLAKKEASLSNIIRELEQEMESRDLAFLQAFKNNKERIKCTLSDPLPVSKALIDVAEHLSNLKFNISKKMLVTVQYTPVTLDPNTAAPWLSLSDDLTSVCYHGDQPHIPNNPERFDEYACVLGAESFTSGSHRWDVEVGDKTRWDLGVVRESVSRKTDVKLSPEHGFWALALRENNQYSACTMPWTRLRLRRKPSKVRVRLDYEKGEVSFYDAGDLSLIHCFRCTFKDRLLPFFSPYARDGGGNAEPLRICPAHVSEESFL